MEEQKSFLIDLAETIDRHLPKRDDREQRSSVLSRGTSHPVLRWLMPNFGTLLLVAVLILTQNVWARQTAGPASPGPSATTVNYQGRLANSDGTPLTEEGVAMSFAIYDAKEDGNLIWPADGEEDHVVDVSDGLFSVPLGSETGGGIPTTTWNGDRYMEITVGGETLEPRELIRSVPIAGMALTVPDGAIGSSQIADGAVGADQLSSGIGPSNAPLMNLVLLDPILVLSLPELSGDIDDTALDLSTYVSDEAVAVLVRASFWGSQSDGTTFRLSKAPNTWNTVAILSARTGLQQGIVPLDPMQQINYRIQDGAGADFQIILLGYYEPVK
jgi:hypothetical protein